jgi:hypothetical protein
MYLNTTGNLLDHSTILSRFFHTASCTPLIADFWQDRLKFHSGGFGGSLQWSFTVINKQEALSTKKLRARKVSEAPEVPLNTLRPTGTTGNTFLDT